MSWDSLQRLNQEAGQAHFDWLRRTARGPTYNSCNVFSHLPSSAFDWGDSGNAGSSNYGGELLYLSAPWKQRGLVMVRGSFSTSLYFSLSRAQNEFDGSSTFGLEVSRADNIFDPNAPKGSDG
ncbi:hypothetical protein B0T24DRAFT_599490 [Lasiosphaeria ovina]|uniref:Uncharacterized protein n=1 Tax=Lasiosphaeria ovina TaxID=92902 RepID=A0AAE0JST2_9PEZI|nr:hypothetical protein B0T24DRAFT_599490 [Lasiosphaeria ovina]